jgi:hypothetical protein
MKEQRERRRHPRLRITDDKPICCCITAVEPGEGNCDSALYDVSRTGFCLLSDIPYGKGTNLRRDIRFGDTLLKDIRAFVVHASNEDGHGWRLGVALNYREGDMRGAEIYNGVTRLLEQLQSKPARSATA